MDTPMEVMFTADASSQHSNCCVWNLETGTLMNSFRGGNSAAKMLTVLGKDYLLSSCPGKPQLNVWTLGKTSREESKFIMPGMLTALAATPCGTFCVGAIESKLHVWKVTTGELLTVASGHYQDVTCLKFCDDGSHLISGGKDAVVLVWTLSGLLNHGNQLQTAQPLHTWSNHSAEITDIYVGSLGSFARVASVSKDETCKVYDMATGQFLFFFCMDIELYSVVMDPAEYFLMMGGANGNIFRINVYSTTEKNSHLSEMKDSAIYKGHSGKVTCLSISTEGSYLLSGSDDNTCRLWHVVNMTCIRTIPHQGPITNAFITIAPHALLASERLPPNFSISTFSRSIASSEEPKDLNSKTEPFKLTGYNLTTCPLNKTYEDFVTTVSCGSQEPGSMSKGFLQTLVNDCDDINGQLFTYSLKSFLNFTESCEKL